MSDWTGRIDLWRAAEMLRAAIRSGSLRGRSAVVFHDLDLMRRRIACLKSAFPPNSLHAIAVKANPLIEVLRVAVQESAGLEAASLEEVHLALAAGCPAGKIVFDSPAKTQNELRESLQLGVLINADNLDELSRIGRLLRETTSSTRVGLRVNTQVGSGRIAATSVADRVSKFGIPIADATSIVSAFETYPWLSGLHAHVGSQGCDPHQLIDSAARLNELRLDVIRRHNRTQINHVDIGGGLPVAYRAQDADSVIAIEDYAELLRSKVPGLFSVDVELITEFGRSIHAGCGVAFSQVEYVKDDGALVVIHFGADMFLRPVYNPDDWHHEMFLLDSRGQPKRGERRARTIAGPLCFGGDIVGRDVLLPSVEPGDWLGIRDVGAYTLSMWSRHCNRGLPLVRGIGADAAQQTTLHEGERPEDVVSYWSSHRDTRYCVRSIGRSDHRRPDDSDAVTDRGAVARHCFSVGDASPTAVRVGASQVTLLAVPDDVHLGAGIRRLRNQDQVALPEATLFVAPSKLQDIGKSCQADLSGCDAGEFNAHTGPLGVLARFAFDWKRKHRQQYGVAGHCRHLRLCWILHRAAQAHQPSIVDTLLFAKPPRDQFSHRPFAALDVGEVLRRNPGFGGDLNLRQPLLQQLLQQRVESLCRDRSDRQVFGFLRHRLFLQA